MNISYDRFIRTTDDYHVEAIQKIFKKMYEKGDIYKGEDACPLPEECYQGADIIARAKEFAAVHGDAYVNKDFDELTRLLAEPQHRDFARVVGHLYRCRAALVAGGLSLFVYNLSLIHI